MLARFFIHHPVFSMVISLLITLGGLTAIKNLPIEQYPNLTPPLISVTATFNGANAQTIADDVASPIEQQILGVQDMIYMYSQNSYTGNMNLSVYFAIGSNDDINQVNVQNLVSQTQAQLPEGVQKEGIIINKAASNILLIVALQSPQGIFDETYISNYASINIVNALELLPGISSVSLIGQRDYAMRIWLRPDLMAQKGISPQDVIAAVKEQNTDFGIGQLGQAPNVHPVSLTIPMTTVGRLSTAEEFGDIIIRADLSGNFVLLKDIADVTLGAQDYTVDGELNGQPAVLVAIYQEYGANALNVAESIRKKMKEISRDFPSGLEYSVPYDTTLFIKISIKEVVRTLLESALLVIIVVFVFLQNLRATLIPLLALIVSTIGAFGGLYLMNYSINTLTMFAMVLAVGIVVDDAIVVVENIEKKMEGGKLKPIEAAVEAMQEVTGPVIAIVCVLCAVFVPIAFLGGIAGILYKQFAITITMAVIVSGVVALTLSPAVSALVLKPVKEKKGLAKIFNDTLEKATNIYLKGSEWIIDHRKVGLMCVVLILSFLSLMAYWTPKSFVPQEDQGYLIAMNFMPDGSSLDRTALVDKKIYEIATKHPGVENVVSLTGFSMVEGLDRTTIGSNFIVLKDWSQRKDKSLSVAAIQKELQGEFIQIQEGQVVCFNPPAISGLGTFGGFEFWIENRGDGGNEALEAMVKKFIGRASQSPVLSPLSTSAQFDNMQFFVDVDRFKAKALGVSVNDIFQALQTLVGSVFINNFNKFGRVYQVIVQANPAYRETIENLGDIYIRSSTNQMVPLKALIDMSYTSGPNLISRFNDYGAVQLFGEAKPGYSTQQAIHEVEAIAEELMQGSDFNFGWSGQAYQEIQAGGSSSIVLIAALIVVFLILAALYERWTVPMAVMMAIPFGAVGAFIAIYLKGISNDVYFQIGLVTLIALSAKNGILIVEFAMLQVQQGKGIKEAALEAAKLRFRAIIMTSLTFILGVLPLVMSRGAGAASRHSVGVGIFGGMIAATTLALLFVPFFFTLFYRKKNDPS